VERGEDRTDELDGPHLLGVGPHQRAPGRAAAADADHQDAAWWGVQEWPDGAKRALLQAEGYVRLGVAHDEEGPGPSRVAGRGPGSRVGGSGRFPEEGDAGAILRPGGEATLRAVVQAAPPGPVAGEQRQHRGAGQGQAEAGRAGPGPAAGAPEPGEHQQQRQPGQQPHRARRAEHVQRDQAGPDRPDRVARDVRKLDPAHPLAHRREVAVHRALDEGKGHADQEAGGPTMPTVSTTVATKGRP
jgi:hypothetical protein